MTKRKRIHAGIGDRLDLKVKKPEKEEVEESFKYQRRYTGKEKHSIPYYPEVPFQYSIQYTGETLETYNEQQYLFDIYAHPEKVFHYKITETKTLPIDRLWEAEAIFDADVKKDTLFYAIVYEGKYPEEIQNTVEWKMCFEAKFEDNTREDYEYAVKWEGLVTVRNYGDMKSIFINTNAHAIKIGKVGDSNWVLDHNTGKVKDLTNTAAVSAISSKNYLSWKNYEVEFKFKPLLATNEPYTNASYRSGNKLIKWKGFDDDIIGFLFKVQDKKNFYCMLWENHKRAYKENSSRPPDNLEDYNIYTNAPGTVKYGKHYGNFTKRSFDENATAPNSASTYYENHRGWETQHRRIYRCIEGKLYRIDTSSRGPANHGHKANSNCKDLKDGGGWLMEQQHYVKIISSGKHIKIQIKRNANDDYYTIFDFNTAYEKGSFGVLNVSQAVEFSQINVVEKETIKGRRPITTSEYETYNGKKIDLGKAEDWLAESIKHELHKKDLDGKSVTLTEMTKDIKSGYEDKGQLWLPSKGSGHIYVKSKSKNINQTMNVCLPADDWLSLNEGQYNYGNAEEFIKNLDGFEDFIKSSGYDIDIFEFGKITPKVKDSAMGTAEIIDEELVVSTTVKEVWHPISGRIPSDSEEWFEWNGSGDKIHANVAIDYIIENIKQSVQNNSDNDSNDEDDDSGGTIDLQAIEFTSLKGVVQDPTVGEVIINSPTAPIVARNYNALDAGEHLHQRYIKCGIVHVTPDNNYDNCVVAFEDIEALFAEEYQQFFERKDLENTKKEYNLVYPKQKEEPMPDGITSTEGGCFLEPNTDEDENVIQCYEDFYFDGTKLCMWSCEFPIVKTEREFFDKIHAYEGLIYFDPLMYFSPNEWTTYTLELDQKGINEDTDEIYWTNGEPFEKAKPGGKLAIQTKEYYIAKYPEGITNKGMINSDENLYIKLPSYPEFYVNEQTGEPMPDIYENIDFLLDPVNNSSYVITNWLSDFTPTNGIITVDEEKPTLNGQYVRSLTNESVPKSPVAAIGRTGMPIIKVTVGEESIPIRHFVEIRCRTKPIATIWNSGKYIGSGILNGRKPFFTEKRGKNDITGVSVDVIQFPDNLIKETLKGPFIEVYDINNPDNPSVKFEYDAETRTIKFTSDLMDEYVWYTKWFSDWIQSDTEFTVTNTERKKIDTITQHYLGEDFNYDEETRTITVEDMEVVSNHPFVYVWKNNLTQDQLDAINKGEEATVDLFAQIISAMPLPWHPMIHNGYYYQDGIEHYLYAERRKIVQKPNSNGEIKLDKRPEQGSPIIVKDNNKKNFRKTSFYDNNWEHTHQFVDEFRGNGKAKYYLKYDAAVKSTVSIYVNDVLLTVDDYIYYPKDNAVEFMKPMHESDLIRCVYQLKDSYYINMNDNVLDAKVLSDTATIHLQPNYNESLVNNMTVEYEGAVSTPYYRATEVKLNPLLNNFHNGFLYIDNEELQTPRFIELEVSQYYVERYQKDRVTLTARVLDELRNPIENENVAFYCNGEMIGNKITNTAGEAYITNVPPEESDLVTEYKAVCRNLYSNTVVNQTRENEHKRYYIEMFADTLIMKANSATNNRIQMRIRDMEWNVLKDGYGLEILIIDTKGNETTTYLVTDSEGMMYLDISAEDEVPGEIFIRAEYDMKFESAVNSMYIRIIGE